MVKPFDVHSLLHQQGFQPHIMMGSMTPPLTAYQRWHGLEESGDVDGPTLRSMNAPRFCGHPDCMRTVATFMAGRTDGLSCWAKKTLTYAIQTDSRFGNLSDSDVADCFLWAFFQWSLACGVTFIASQVVQADITIYTGQQDGPWGNLAYSEMPDGTDHPLKIKFDAEEKWVAVRPPNRWHVDLGQVAMHEIGHVLGIPHLPGDCVMGSIYNRVFLSLQDADVTEARKRYPL